MPVAHATRLAHQLAPSVPAPLAARIAAYDWHQATIVERGKDHTVLIATDVVVVRVLPRSDTDLRRKMRMLEQLTLSWLVPTPLSLVDEGVLQRYTPGTAHPHGGGCAATLAHVVSVFDG